MEFGALPMNSLRYIYWQEDDMWLGYLEDYPDYRTQGESLEELQENLKDIYADLIGGAIPNVKHVGELQIS
jgi:predicted RNase H-like HicB family nuclease